MRRVRIRQVDRPEDAAEPNWGESEVQDGGVGVEGREEEDQDKLQNSLKQNKVEKEGRVVKSAGPVIKMSDAQLPDILHIDLFHTHPLGGIADDEHIEGSLLFLARGV
jgi:hypothetical protein